MWRMRGAAWLASPAMARAARLYRFAGIAVFVALAVWTVLESGALRPSGTLDRLFLGVGLLALAAAGRGAARALGPGRRGVLPRGGDALTAAAAVGVLAAALFLAAAARPIPETLLAHVDASAGSAQVNGVAVRTTADGEIGVEYLQVTHEALGYSRIVPLAYVGAERVAVRLDAPVRWIVRHLRTHAETWERRGVTVRVRRDSRRVTPGERYDVVEIRGQLLIRRATATRS
jgi:hypothetical protein